MFFFTDDKGEKHNDFDHFYFDHFYSKHYYSKECVNIKNSEEVKDNDSEEKVIYQKSFMKSKF